MKILLTALGVAIVAVAALLLWPRSGDTHQLVADSQRYSFKVSAQPLKQGVNSLDIEITDRAGNPATGDVTIEPAMPQMGHALSPVTASPHQPGRYRVDSVDLPMAGQWEVTVSLGTDRVVVPLLLT
ncbi:FixH family protein [Kibdelosporangium persicum]|uniref:YtkA domain-containing protein n=1 Tax=Kibdelosporangium persicum TaxID=2698649 RepID=A0ABX2F9S7_9PSEU|nr:FixH family protein [Kibdelosporangium persicum]NRN68123.1 YtkA domain-containing protein [Kibdelosporangium persicum]